MKMATLKKGDEQSSLAKLKNSLNNTTSVDYENVSSDTSITITIKNILTYFKSAIF